MAEPRANRCRHPALIAVTVAATACSAAPPPSTTPVPQTIAGADLDAAAQLMALEDRREYDVWTVGPAAAAPHPFVREHAALTIARLREPAGGTLARILLQDEDSAVAAAGAFASGLLADTAAVDPLAAVFADSTVWRTRPTVAVEAARALGRIGTGRSQEVLLDLLATGDPADSILGPIAAEALLAITPTTDPVAPTIIRWTESRFTDVRRQAAYALTRPPRPGGVRTARALLSDADPIVRSVALRGLGASVVDAAGESREEVLATIIPLTADSAYPVRIEAIRMLGTYTEVRSIETLRDLLGSPRPHDIATAFESLGRLGASAAPAVITMMGRALDPALDPYLRGLGLVSLAGIDSTSAEPLVRDFATSENWRLRAAAADAVVRVGLGGLPTLLTLARDADPRVSAAAVRAATLVTDSTSALLLRPLLVELLSSPDVHVRTASLEGLVALADPSTYPALLDAYDRAQHDREPDAALAAIDAIARVGETGAVQPERAFFARFPRPLDHLVRRRAVERFGDLARAAWGDPLPVTDPTPRNYRALVERWLVPPDGSAEPVVVRLDTESGIIDIELFGGIAPLTVTNFLDLVDARYFDGQEWPRVVPNFVVQGGDPRGDTSGGPGYTIRNELNRARFTTGMVGMALAGPDTGGSQFFIVHSPQPHLDGTYTVFGRLLSGGQVLEQVLPGERLNSVRRLDGQL